MPGPVGQRCVYEDGKEGNKKYVGTKSDTTCKRTGNKCRCDNRKFHLENGEKGEWNGRSQCGIDIAPNSFKHKIGEGISYQTILLRTYGITEGEAESKQDPDHTDHPHGDKTLQHGGDDVFGLDHSSVKEGEPRGHKKDKGSRG